MPYCDVAKRAIISNVTKPLQWEGEGVKVGNFSAVYFMNDPLC